MKVQLTTTYHFLKHQKLEGRNSNRDHGAVYDITINDDLSSENCFYIKKPIMMQTQLQQDP